MLCKKCGMPIDLTDAGLTCKHCKYDNQNNPENLTAPLSNPVGQTGGVQYTCPKCGSHSVKVMPQPKVEDTAFNPSNAAMGCCCFGLPGLLCGLTGGKKLSMSTEKVCDSCGAHFV